MFQTKIDLLDLYVSIKSDAKVKFTWTATYTSSTILKLSLELQSVLQGTEVLEIKFINDKVFRGPDGGCVEPDKLSTNLKSSLLQTAESAEAISDITSYLILAGIIFMIALLFCMGGTLEMIWSLINTLQLI